MAVRESPHRLVLTEAIRDEWNRHQSGFARDWRRSMFARRRVEALDVPADETFREQLDDAADSDRERAAMLKDAHLIEAAVATGRRVASLDDAIRGYYQQAAGKVPALRAVCWVNPEVEDEDAVGWLKKGAPLNKFRLLGYGASEE